MTWRRSSTSSRDRRGPAGRWIHFGLTSSDVLDTALALQLRRAGEVILPGARELARALAERAREHAGTLCVGRTHGVHAEPTSFGLKLAGFALEAHRNADRLQRAFAQAATGAISGAVGTYAVARARIRGAGAGAAGPRRRAGLHPGRAARPPRRAAERDRARGRRARALRAGDPPSPAHRGARGRGAVPGRAEGLERDAAQAQPDHHRAHLRAGARAARLRAGRARERRAVARARHLALGRRAHRAARRDDPARLHAAPDAAGRARDGRARRPDGREPRAHQRRAVLPARAARARRARLPARRRLPARAAAGPGGVGHRHASANIARARARRRPRSRRGVRLQPLHPPRARGAAAAGGRNVGRRSELARIGGRT